MRRIIKTFDRWVAVQQGIIPFSKDESCILRIQPTRLSYPLHLPGKIIPTGERVLRMHLWNDHLPTMPLQGADLGWAAQTWQRFTRSLRLLAAYIPHDAQLANARAVGGVSALFTQDESDSGARLMERLGFMVLPEPSPLGRLGRFGENVYSWLLLWAFNPGSMRSRRLLKLERTGIWMELDEFLKRFGEKKPA